MTWPYSFGDVLAARDRIRPHLAPTPLRRYAPLDAAVGHGIAVLVKHENHCPTNAFKARNGLAVVSALSPDEKRRGVVSASRGNHGQGLAWAGAIFGAPVTICVPVGNNPEKNEAIRGYGATLVEEGQDYEASLAAAERLVHERGVAFVHASNDVRVLAGAATLSLEVLEQEDQVDAFVIAIGGGSQALGAVTVARELAPNAVVYGVQAEGAAAIHDSWHAKQVIERPSSQTFADGIATRRPPELTFPALLEGLSGFVTVSESEIASALRLLLRTTHQLVEGAGAAGLAGLIKLADRLAGRRVVVILSGGNIDQQTLRRVVDREI